MRWREAERGVEGGEKRWREVEEEKEEEEEERKEKRGDEPWVRSKASSSTEAAGRRRPGTVEAGEGPVDLERFCLGERVAREGSKEREVGDLEREKKKAERRDLEREGEEGTRGGGVCKGWAGG